MKALIEYLARALADHPEDVSVEEVHQGRRVSFHLFVHDDDKGRIIGKDGRCAHALRSILQAAATRAGVRASLSIE